MTLVCAMAMTVASAFAQPQAAPEYQVKAAFIYNLAQFIEWPEQAFKDAGSPLTVCVFDTNTLGNALEPYRNETVKGRKLVIKQYGEAQDMMECHILFLNSTDKKLLKQVLDTVKNQNILTIGEAEGFARMGGIINFIKVKNKIHFEINVDAAKKAGFNLSSEILKLAKIVREK